MPSMKQEVHQPDCEMFQTNVHAVKSAFKKNDKHHVTSKFITMLFIRCLPPTIILCHKFDAFFQIKSESMQTH